MSFSFFFFSVVLLLSTTTVYYCLLLDLFIVPRSAAHTKQTTHPPLMLSLAFGVRCPSDAHLIISIIIIISSHHSFKRTFDFTTGIPRDPKAGLMD
jgi:hypothetical protein